MLHQSIILNIPQGIANFHDQNITGLMHHHTQTQRSDELIYRVFEHLFRTNEDQNINHAFKPDHSDINVGMVLTIPTLVSEWSDGQIPHQIHTSRLAAKNCAYYWRQTMRQNYFGKTA